MHDKTMAITRGVIALMTIVNLILVAFGMNPIDVDEGMITEAVSAIAVIVAAVWVWWKNNNITPEAVEAQKEFELKKKKKN